ncbi:MAG: hypothetical protein RL064_498 [Bacteroidota bacterium]|jgi:endonuclease/exonuclease/phosphatase family metal-dependent hydrolase
MNYRIVLIVVLLVIANKEMKAQNINIASYNIRYDNKNDSGNLWADRLPKIVSLIQYHDFDIIGLQESLYHQLKGLKKELDEFEYYGIGRDDGIVAGEFSAILFKKSKFEVIDKGNFWLSASPDTPSKGWDANIKRICTWVKLKENQQGKTFFVFNVHFDHEGYTARRESSKLILQKIKAIALNSPVVLTGDFNGDHDSDWYKTIQASPTLKDAYFLVPKPYALNGSFNAFNASAIKSGVIDHIFVTDHFKVTKYGLLTDSYFGKYPSDHFPVVIAVRM